MKRLKTARRLLAYLGALTAAFVLSFVWPKINGLGFEVDGSPRAQAARNKEPYDLTRLQVLNRVILEVNQHYVDPSRVKPKQMFLAGLNGIQANVAPVLVHYQADARELAVQVNEQRRSFPVDDVDSPWKLAGRFRDVFAFLQKNLGDEEDLDLRDVEYAAVNGMLRTLDPHTVLLTPDVFEEMQMSTRGEFGGLGIVISIRDGHLTVIRPMPNTPASRAGLERGDRIVKINEESTLNMPLSEAVDRLRGAPGSRVRVFISRKKADRWSAPRKVDLVRAVIHIESVTHRMLEAGVGYIKVNSFQGNTHGDMTRALSELHQKGMKGLTLDLRDNPGGLLDQAVLVADTFLSSGTIVTTSSNDPRQRDEKFATRQGTEPSYPMVVLINSSSASASEIVAGALKNHDRALVIGQRSFGKGSVQVLHTLQDGSALKLTIAQYLTPGDVSIQGVGIDPDITIDPMTVDAEDMDLAVDDAHVRESDLRSHLTHERARQSGDAVVLRYYLPREQRRKLIEAAEEDSEENEREGEFLTRFSQRLLGGRSRGDRRELLASASSVLDEVRQQEIARAVEELGKLGIDWSTGPDQGESQLVVKASTSRKDGKVTAGESFELTVEVSNRGDKPVYQLRGVTKSDYRLFDGRELVFGKLAPGDTRRWTTTLGFCSTEDEKRVCRLPRDIPDRADGIRVEFEELHGHGPEAQEIRTVVRALPRPQFAYSLQVADNISGNGDGVAQRGEQLTVFLRLKNVGKGKTYKTQANLQNLSGSGILLRNGRFALDDMQPGEERVVNFTFEVLPDFERNEAKLELTVADSELRESLSEKFAVPVSRKAGAPVARSGSVSIRDGAALRVAPDANAEIVARIQGGKSLPAKAELGGFTRLDLGDGHPAWVANSDIGGSGSRGGLQFELSHSPPRLELQVSDALVTRGGQISVRGHAEDEQQVRDLYIFVGARKVYYRSNNGDKKRSSIDFETPVELQDGVNYVTVVVRENADAITRKTLVVRRDGSDGRLLKTPDIEENLLGVQ